MKNPIFFPFDYIIKIFDYTIKKKEVFIQNYSNDMEFLFLKFNYVFV